MSSSLLISIRAAISAGCLGILVAGCATPQKPLYHWGHYQPVVYEHFKGASPEEQQARLELTAQEAASLGVPVPPGFHAHWGLLHLNTGQMDAARKAFEMEAALFPESRPYMNFLLGRMTAARATRGIP